MTKFTHNDIGKWVRPKEDTQFFFTHNLYQITGFGSDGWIKLDYMEEDFYECSINPEHLRFATHREISKWLESHNELTIVKPRKQHPTDAIERVLGGTKDFKKSDDYDMVNPSHYKNTSIETIDKMVAVWGVEATAIHCEMCAFKYRERIGSKPGQSLEQEMAKIRWYEKKAKQIRGLANEK